MNTTVDLITIDGIDLERPIMTSVGEDRPGNSDFVAWIPVFEALGRGSSPTRLEINSSYLFWRNTTEEELIARLLSSFRTVRRLDVNILKSESVQALRRAITMELHSLEELKFSW